MSSHGVRKKVYIFLVLSIVWIFIIFIGCTLPPAKIPELKIPHFDKAAHFGFFFIQSVLLSLFFRYKTGKSNHLIIIFVTLLALVYGGCIEILQSEFFNRTGDLYDLFADVLGGFSGAISYFFFANVLSKKV